MMKAGRTCRSRTARLVHEPQSELSDSQRRFDEFYSGGLERHARAEAAAGGGRPPRVRLGRAAGGVPLARPPLGPGPSGGLAHFSTRGFGGTHFAPPISYATP